MLIFDIFFLNVREISDLLFCCFVSFVLRVWYLRFFFKYVVYFLNFFIFEFFLIFKFFF